jgi:hypothetical protein
MLREISQAAPVYALTDSVELPVLILSLATSPVMDAVKMATSRANVQTEFERTLLAIGAKNWDISLAIAISLDQVA